MCRLLFEVLTAGSSENLAATSGGVGRALIDVHAAASLVRDCECAQISIAAADSIEDAHEIDGLRAIKVQANPCAVRIGIRTAHVPKGICDAVEAIIG